MKKQIILTGLIALILGVALGYYLTKNYQTRDITTYAENQYPGLEIALQVLKEDLNDKTSVECMDINLIKEGEFIIYSFTKDRTNLNCFPELSDPPSVPNIKINPETGEAYFQNLEGDYKKLK